MYIEEVKEVRYTSLSEIGIQIDFQKHDVASKIISKKSRKQALRKIFPKSRQPKAIFHII